MKEARKATVEFCKEIARGAVSLTPEQTRQFSLNEKVRSNNELPDWDACSPDLTVPVYVMNKNLNNK